MKTFDENWGRVESLCDEYTLQIELSQSFPITKIISSLR